MKRTSKLLVLLLSLSLLLGAIVGLSVTASAEEGPTAEIKGKNMSYTGAPQVMYYLKVEGLTEEEIGDRVKLLVSDKSINVAKGDTIPDDVSVKIHRGTLTVAATDYAIFFSDAIAPAELRKSIYAVPVILDAEDATKIEYAGTPSEYSPYTYAINRFSQSPTPDQKTLYKALLDYGAAVQDVLLTDDEITANGGWADAYYKVRLDTYVDGRLLEEGEAPAEGMRPSEVLTAANKLNEQNVQGVFAGFTLNDAETFVYDENESFVNLTLNCSSIPEFGNQVIRVNYSTKAGAFDHYTNFNKDYQYNGSTYQTSLTGVDGAYAILNDNTGNKSLRLGSTNVNGGGGAVKNMNFINGDVYVIDTDFTFDTNFKYSSGGDKWPLKLFLVSEAAANNNYEFVNFTFAPMAGENTEGLYTIREKGEFKLGKQYNLRIEYIPGTNCKVYIDGVEFFNSTEAPKTSDHQFKGIAVSFRGANMLSSVNTTVGNITATMDFDNTYMGALSKNYVVESRTNDFSDPEKVDGITSAATVNYSGGAAVVTMTNDKSIYFKPLNDVANANANVVYAFEMDFTYNGGTLKDKTKDNSPGAAFLGFSWKNGGGDSVMYKYTTMTLGGTADPTTGIMPYVTMYGQRYNVGDTVKIRYEFNPGTKSMRIYHDGVLVTQAATASTMVGGNADRNNTVLYAGTKMASFSMQFRGATYSQVNTDCTFTIDNTNYEVIYASGASNVTLDYNNNGLNANETMTLNRGEIVSTIPTEFENRVVEIDGVKYESRFEGWKYGYTPIQNGDVWNGYTGNKITAQWTDYKTITLSTEFGTLEKTTLAFINGGEYTLEAPVVNDNRYDFLGWYNGDTEIAENGTWSYDKNMTLVAKWNVPYDVTIDGNGGTVNGSENVILTVKYGEAYDLTSYILAKEGILFAGWSVNDELIEATGTWNYERPAAGDSITVKAEWYDPRTITLDPGEGTLDPGDITQFTIKFQDAYGGDGENEVKLPTPTAPENLKFLGWYVGEGLLKRVSEKGTWMINKDVTLTAKYGYDFKAGTDSATYPSTAGQTLLMSDYPDVANSEAGYATGTKYVFNATFTYLGGGPKKDGTNVTQPAFISFVGLDKRATITNNGNTYNNTNYQKPYLEARIRFEYITYTEDTIEVGGKEYYSGVKFGGFTFEYGVQYHIRLEYIVDGAATLYILADDGSILAQSAFGTHSGNNYDDQYFGGFAIQMRSSHVGQYGLQHNIKDISVVVEKPDNT